RLHISVFHMGTVCYYRTYVHYIIFRAIVKCFCGIGIVFFGLVCIVLLCIVMSAIFKAFSKVNKSNEKTPVEVAVAQEAVIENKQEFVAAVSAAIAEEMGTDVSAIRIKSIKKL
ncbi:MAG: OadG family protein, partial [Clostridia bacterium]|nr:OadG family protein [Clostridia bacterium]